MKTIYRCEICGEEFNENWELCRDHEKLCKEKHATGVRLAEEINRAIETAITSGNVKIGAWYGDSVVVYRVSEVRYNPKTQQVELGIEHDDELARKQESKEGSK